MNRVGSVLLNYFSVNEFRFPDQMDSEFLMYLDGVRGACNVPFSLTGDARSPQHNADVGGVPTSLHLFDPSNKGFKCRAVDFSIPEFEQHVSPWATFAQISEAVSKVWRDHRYPYGYELEFQYGEHNKHIHLGLFRVPGHLSHLVVKGDMDVKP